MGLCSNDGNEREEKEDRKAGRKKRGRDEFLYLRGESVNL